LLEGCSGTLLPVEFAVQKDEMVTSDTDPTQKLRRPRGEISTAREIDGRKWGHPSVIYLPVNRRVSKPTDRRGKVVIVWAAELGWPGHRPVARRVPGQLRRADRRAHRLSHDDLSDPRRVRRGRRREISIGFLGRRYQQTTNLADTAYVRLAIPYLWAMDGWRAC